MESHIKIFLYREGYDTIPPMITMENVLQENASLKALVSELKEQLDWFKKQLFGTKSEKHINDENEQLKFPGIEILKPEEKEVEIKGHTRRTNAQEQILIPKQLQNLDFRLRQSTAICRS